MKIHRSTGSGQQTQGQSTDVSFETLNDVAHNKKNPFDTKKTGRGVLGGSQAADPAFEKKAEAFEMRFGNAIMSDSKVTAPVQAMCDQIVSVIAAYWKTSSDDKATTMEEQVGKMLGTRPKYKGVAGAVTADKVYAHVLEGGGNTRTKMTALYNFGRPFEAALKSMNEKNETASFLAELESADNIGAKATELSENPGGRLTPSPRSGSEVANQADTRGAHGNAKSWASTRSVDDVGGLHEDEMSFQGLDSGEDKVKWEEGARKWLINEDAAWVEQIRELSLPLKAGPSGTTDRIMQTGDILGVTSAEDTRAACLAYLLPINAHSMVEIMEAASRFGLAYTAGPGMYANVAPFGSLAAYSPDDLWWSTVTGGSVDEDESPVVDDP